MYKLWSKRPIVITTILCSALGAVLFLTHHRVVLVTLLGLAFLATAYSLTQLVEADWGPQERWRKKARMEALLADGPTGVWAQILGPKGVKIFLIIGGAALMLHLIADLFVGR
ncbi:hypothetical protein ACN8ZM_39900 (plasmid) [Burkholderia aenigmatica]|uniref:hypothetical protein n=1 Tax=Burkholderia aenigmatica TaxID=2015348 RepID=UPI003B433AFB